MALLEDSPLALKRVDFDPDELAEIDRHATEREIKLWDHSSTA